MIKVKRENVIYSICEEEKGEYLKKGYSLLDSTGKEIKEKQKNKDKESEILLEQIKGLTETIDALTKKNGELEAEKVTLTETIDALTKQVENLTKLVEDSKKKSKE